MKKVLCLYRVSTEKQLSENDIPMQHNACLDFIAKNPDWELYKEYKELGISGFKVSCDDRETIVQIKQEAEQGNFDVLLVFMFDRLGRREFETPFLINWFVQNGVEVWSVKEGQQKIDDHTDNLINYIRFWQASGESKKTSMRVEEAMSQMVREGRYSGGKPPYGYDLVTTDKVSKKGVLLKELVINEEQAKIVKMIFELSVERGRGINKSAKLLNDSGYTTLSGGQWTASHISKLLANPIYKGYMVYGRHRFQGKKRIMTDPTEWILSDHCIENITIVSEKMWAEAQAIKEKRKKANREQCMKNGAIPDMLMGNAKLLFVGLIKCGCCGYAVQTGHKNLRGKNPDGTPFRKYTPFYKCVSVVAGRHCDLKQHFSQEVVEGVVLNEVYQYLDKMEKVDLSREIAKLKKQNLSEDLKLQKELQCQHLQLEKELTALKAEIVKVITGTGNFTANILNELIETKSIEIVTVQNRLAQLCETIDRKNLEQSDLMQLKSTIPVWKEEFEKADLDTKKLLLSKIIDRITLHNDRIEVKLKLPIDSFLDENNMARASGDRNPYLQQHGGAVHHPAVFADERLAGAGLAAF